MFAGPRDRGDADGGAGNAFGGCADRSVGLPDAAHARAGRGPRLHGGAGALHAEAAPAGVHLWRQVSCCTALSYFVISLSVKCCSLERGNVLFRGGSCIVDMDIDASLDCQLCSWDDDACATRCNMSHT